MRLGKTRGTWPSKRRKVLIGEYEDDYERKNEQPIDEGTFDGFEHSHESFGDNMSQKMRS